jgi:hypothetical protein
VRGLHHRTANRQVHWCNPTGGNGCLRKAARLPHGPGGSRGQQPARSTLGCLHAAARAKGLPPLGKCSVCRAASLCETDESTLGSVNRRKSPEVAPSMGSGIGPKRRTQHSGVDNGHSQITAFEGRTRVFGSHQTRGLSSDQRGTWAMRGPRHRPPDVHMHRSPKLICDSAFVKSVKIMSQEPWWNCADHGGVQTAAVRRDLWRPSVK